MLRLLFLLIKVAAWTPIGSVYNLPEISSIKIAEKDYVVWKNFNDDFVVQEDICPHRLAPLSEGRVVGKSLECGYHGWKFTEKGKCCNIPQQERHYQLSSKCDVKTYQVKKTGDILWACLDKRLINKFSVIEQDDILMNSDVPYIREVPYSWGYLLENFFDPAHIPFAHHGMQSFRRDSCPIPIELETFSKKEVVLNFKDVTAGNKRHGKIVYKAPYLYKLYKKADIRTSEWTNDLTILCVPVKPGRSRVFMCYDKRKTQLGPNPGKMRKNQHLMSNKFFNTDDYLVHKQEINAGKKRSYNMQTRSDYGIKVIRSWVEKYYSAWNYQNTEELTKEEACDNYRNHVKLCKDCSFYYNLGEY